MGCVLCVSSCWLGWKQSLHGIYFWSRSRRRRRGARCIEHRVWVLVLLRTKSTKGTSRPSPWQRRHTNGMGTICGQASETPWRDDHMACRRCTCNCVAKPFRAACLTRKPITKAMMVPGILRTSIYVYELSSNGASPRHL